MSLITRKKYLVHSEQWFGCDKIKIFGDEQKQQAFNYAREWVKETKGEIPIVVSIFEPNEDGTYTYDHDEEP